MNQLEFLVEEKSIAEVLRVLLPKILPEGWTVGENCFIRTHEGKQDLQKSIIPKIRAASRSGLNIGFVIIQDQDNDDCKELKNKIEELCLEAMPEGKEIPICVRIVCHELESWYLGDCRAIEQVFPCFKARHFENKRSFKYPDSCINPKRMLKGIVGEYSQIDVARRMAPLLNPTDNRSYCLSVFLKGVQSIANRVLSNAV